MNSDEARNEFFGEEMFDFEAEKKAVIANLDWLKSCSVEEFTFYKKHQEIITQRDKIANAGRTKARIWRPNDLNDEEGTIKEIEALKPKVICTLLTKNVESDNEDWLNLRIFSHSAEHIQAPCRFLKFLVVDEVTNQILGFFSVASDVISIKDRDDYIGWTHDNRIKDHLLNYSCIATTIASTQPLGYNFLGGKFIASLVPTSVMRNAWKTVYADLIVGVTTTSLYGIPSMYTRLPAWHECGESAGKIAIKPDEKYYELWHDWIKKHRKEEYDRRMTQKEGVSGPVTSAKMRVLHMIFNELGIKQSSYNHGHRRGVYYASVYENTKDFLCKKIEEKDLKMKSSMVGDVQFAVDWWKPKAIARYKKMKQENRLKPEILYYNRMVDMTYDQAKQAYFIDVGR
jgi:hypothetical protein